MGPGTVIKKEIRRAGKGKVPINDVFIGRRAEGGVRTNSHSKKKQQ